MSSIRIPLVGVHNQRGIDAQTVLAIPEDQRFVNCTFDVVKNPVTGKGTLYVEKRPGWGVSQLISAGNLSTGLIRTDSIGSVVSAFGSTNSTIYDSQTSVGAITGLAIHFSETILSGTGFILIRSSDGTMWFYAADSATTLTYTGDTHTNTTIDNIASTAGMYSGQAISGTNIVAGTRISSVSSGVAIVTDTATTGTTAGVTITKTPIAKVLDSDFITTGTNKSGFVEMDGYVFYASEDGFIYHSDLNSIIAWTAGNKIAANMAPDLPVSIARHKNLIICPGNNSTEFFYNAGNASGSVLSRAEQYFQRIGNLNQRSMVALEDDIYSVSSSRDGDVKAERMRGLSIQPVSTPAVNKILGTSSSAGSLIYASAFNLGGYSYVLLVNISSAAAGDLLLESDDYILLEDGTKIILEGGEGVVTTHDRMMVYNVNLNIWCEWNSSVCTFVRGLGSSSLNQIIATSRINSSGKIYLINPTGGGQLYQDDGSAYTMTIQTSKLDHDSGDWKFISRIDLIADQQASGTTTLEASDDDYATWVTLGTFDMTQPLKSIYRCGSYVGGRAYRLTHSANTAWRGSALDIYFDKAAA